jgi:L-amino acid N-acyltransferase YncA
MIAVMTLEKHLLRPAVATDMPAIHAIYSHHVLHGKASFEEVPPTLEELQHRWETIAAKGLPYLVVTNEAQQILGYAYASLYRPRSAYRFTVEDSIYVAPNAVGLGVGRTLLQALIELSTALGYRQMIAVIGDSANAASIGVHAAAGFTHVGTLPAVGFKFGLWIDSVFMQRALGEGARSVA